MQKGAQVAYLVLGQSLELFEVVHAGVEIALQQFAQNLQPHLQADEALQRAIVEIGGDADAFCLARLFGRLFGLGELGAQSIRPARPGCVY